MIVVTPPHPRAGCKMYETAGDFAALDAMREAVGFDYERRHASEHGGATVARLDFVPLNDEQREEAIRLNAAGIMHEEGDIIEGDFPRPESIE